MQSPLSRILLAILLPLSATTALAQLSIQPPAPEPSPPPRAPAEPAPAAAPATQPAGPAIPSAGSILQDLLREKTNTESPAAAVTTRPSATRPAEALSLREGQIIDLRSGRLAKAPSTGMMEFVFAPAADEPDYPPMPIVPSRRLAAMEDASDYGSIPMTFRIVAEVTQYRGKYFLYLKPTGSATPVAPADLPPIPATAPATQPALPGIPVIRTVAPHTPAAAGGTVSEGQTLSNRVGRLVRDEKTGSELFVLDSDGTPMYDPPMGLIPCKNLALLEDATDHGAKEQKFRVSGEITQYRGKNFLYLKFIQAVKDLNQGLGG